MNMSVSCHPSRGATPALVLLSCLTLSLRGEANEPAQPLAGAVDSGPFARLAGEDDELVEVDLKPSVLRALSRAASAKSKDDGRALANLSSVRAVIVGIDPARVDVASKQIDTTAAELRAKGWEEMARIREKGTRIRVFLLGDHERVAGLTVLMLERQSAAEDGGASKTQVVFANLTGPFDLADLGKLSGRLDIPGLDTVLGSAGLDDAGKQRSAKSDGGDGGGRSP